MKGPNTARLRTIPGENGLQRERTILSWQRTALAFLACGLVIGHGVVTDALSWGEVALGALLALVGAAACATQINRHRRTVAIRPGNMLLFALIAGVITAAGVASWWMG